MTLPRKLAIAWLVTLLTALALGAAEESLIDSPMYDLPAIPGPKSIIEHLDAKDLWLKALNRPDAEMKCRAADTIASAHRKGVKGLEIAIDPLRQAFNQKDAHPATRLATARALIQLDAKSAAEDFLTAAKSSTGELSELVEPALARWDVRAARSLWLDRLKDDRSSPLMRSLAIRSLAEVKEKEAIAPLQKLVLPTNREPMIRLEAARSLGILQTEGLEEQARSLSSDRSPRGIPNRLVAVRLIRHHRSEVAAQLLLGMLKDEESTVCLMAAESLLANDSKRLLDSLDLLLSHRDPGVRRIGVEVIRQHPDLERIDRLIGRFSDDHVDVRTDSRKALIELAKDAPQKERMLQGAMKILASQDWKALEQSAILLTLLDHKPAAKPLVAVLKNPRPEAFMAAAWGLRKLDVPETLPGVLQYLGERYAIHRTADSTRPNEGWYDHQCSQLIQFLGQRKYGPADRLMRQFVELPLGPLLESRRAAVWCLGMIHEGKAIVDLSATFESAIRASRAPIPTEDGVVARMAAISLGRMKSKNHLGVLRQYYSAKRPSFDILNNASGWAIEQITGEKVPEPGEARVPRSDWFLIPIKE